MRGLSRRGFLQAAAAMATLPWLAACRDAAVPGIGPGASFPKAALPDLAGKSIDLTAFSGAALLVNFWATWCGPCRREMPSLQKLSTLFEPRDLRVVGISVDDDLNLVREFLLRYRILFPVLTDQGQHLARDALHIPVFPTTYLLGQGGVVLRVIAGEQEWAAEPMLASIEQAAGVRRRSAAG